MVSALNDRYIEGVRARAKELGIPFAFSNKEILYKLQNLQRSGSLDVLYSSTKIAEIIKDKGFSLRDGLWIPD